MINARLLAPLALTLALGTAPLLAQPETTDPEASAAGSAEKPAAQQAAPAPSEPAAKSSGSSGNSPFDYRSSEEISEDVPVSFPVDI